MSFFTSENFCQFVTKSQQKNLIQKGQGVEKCPASFQLGVKKGKMGKLRLKEKVRKYLCQLFVNIYKVENTNGGG